MMNKMILCYSGSRACVCVTTCRRGPLLFELYYSKYNIVVPIYINKIAVGVLADRYCCTIAGAQHNYGIK